MSSITYPPEMLPRSDKDDDADVVAVCITCNGLGHVEAQVFYTDGSPSREIEQKPCPSCDGKNVWNG